MNTLAPNSPPALPSTPLEAPVRGDDMGSYLDYWPRQLEANPELYGAYELAERTAQRSQYLRDPSSILSPRLVTGWDGALGAFNHMRDGRDMLLGAARILKSNVQQSVKVPSVLHRNDPEDITDEFLDATDYLDDMEAQRPTKYLIMAGQLVCKTAWTYEDLDRREDLLEIAARMYRRVYDADGKWDDYVFKAGQYLADIESHQHCNKIRSARRSHADVSELRGEAVALLNRQGDDMLRHANLSGCLSGDIFEPFARYVVRSKILLDDDIKGNHPEVRTAFRSEDCAEEPREREVDSKFDVVLQRYTSNAQVIGAEPWQLKLGNFTLDSRERSYHPAIKVVVAEGITLGTMIDVIRALKRANTSGDKTDHSKKISKISRLFEPLIARPKKAA